MIILFEKKLNILIIEDNPEILFNLKLIFELNKFSVQTANDGLDAIKFLKSSSYLPDLILSDVSMPKLDGYGLLKELNSNQRLKNIPFVFLSAEIIPDPILDDYPDFSYLTKPVNETELLKTIKSKLKVDF